MCYVPFRPCVQGFAYRSATLKHVSEGIDRGRALPVCTIHEKTVKLNVNIQKDKNNFQFRLHCNDEEKNGRM